MEGRLPCPHVTFYTSSGWGRWGLGRFRVAVDWLRLPLLVLLAVRQILQNSSDAIMTLLHGRFYFAAWAAGRITGKPLIVFVHDYFLSDTGSLSGKMVKVGTRAVLRSAARIYAVSDGMRQKLRNEFGVESHLQLPATKALIVEAAGRPWGVWNKNLRIVYAGAITRAVEDCLDLLIRVITDGGLKQHGIDTAEIQMFSKIQPEQVMALGWSHCSVKVTPWIPQSQVPQALAKADILFLPFSFREDMRDTTETAFPSKTADYLASGRPILVFGPNYSSLVKYASQQGFAEVVREFSSVSLARGILNIALSPSRQKTLATRSLEIFSRNHEIESQQDEFKLSLHEVARSTADNLN